jgi:16S rRNA processing protein RimM
MRDRLAVAEAPAGAKWMDERTRKTGRTARKAPGKTEPAALPARPEETARSCDLLEIAEIVKTWGLMGHVKLLSHAESPDLFTRVREFYVRRESGTIPLLVEDVREHGGQVMLKFRGRDRIEDVEDLVRKTLYMHKRDLDPLEPGEYYWYQLIGMEVRTDTGQELGILREILSTGGSDVYVVRKGSRELLIPASREVIREVDLPGNRMTVHPLEGMLEEHDR